MLLSTNPSKACGCDNISNFFLRIRAFVLAPILAVYFGKALELGIFPHFFKTAKVIPIFKSGNKDNISNYRPIALLPNLSKILEKLIKNRFTKFFCKNKILYDFINNFIALIDFIALISFNKSETRVWCFSFLSSLVSSKILYPNQYGF